MMGLGRFLWITLYSINVALSFYSMYLAFKGKDDKAVFYWLGGVMAWALAKFYL